MTKFTEVMIDIETTGFDANQNGILSIAAIPFDFHQQLSEIPLNVSRKAFYGVCNPIARPLRRTWDPKTFKFHLENNTGLIDRETEELVYEGSNSIEMFLEFTHFIVTNCEHNVNFWAKPSHFDYPFVASHLVQLEKNKEYRDGMGYKAPLFHYQNTRDLGTVISVLGKRDVSDLPKSEKHDALNDAEYQLSLINDIRQFGAAGIVGNMK